MPNTIYTLHLGDCLEVLKTLEENSVDSIVTDPPYGLNFMGQKWDGAVPGVEVWQQCLRVLKPGGHLVAFGGSRTYHHLALGVEQAGFEVRDQILWLYGSGFPKSHDISKAIDKRAPPEAQQWDGWGTALKPAHEPAVLARKPFQGTVADNVLTHGTGGLNLDGCRVDISGDNYERRRWEEPHVKTKVVYSSNIGAYSGGYKPTHKNVPSPESGRHPANLMHDGSPAVWDVLGEQHRYFYCGKATPADRNEGLEGMPEVRHSDRKKADGVGGDNPRNRTNKERQNFHPTVKPTDLMAYLCRLITPPGGTVLDPFMGSGSTGKAAMLEGFRFIGIELNPDYLEIARARIQHAARQPKLFKAS